ncbi:preprotein translocase subunit SecE [Candidatus Woesebacteria bacterium]|nr:preprotein translocase subunit SecE [Candidatus Woesebacteria bacterium]
MFRLDQYVHETVQEIKQVSWPTKKQTIDMTMLVIIVSIVLGAYIGILDYLFQSIVAIVL